MSRRANKRAVGKRAKLEPLEARTLYSADLMSAALGAVPAADTLDIDLTANEWSAITGVMNSDDSVKDKRRELVIIDENTPDYQLLIQDLQNNPPENTQFEIITIAANDNGVELIGDVLANKSNIDALHLIAHGSDGNVNLGNTTLNNNSFDELQSNIAKWGHAFTTEGDLLIYGCDFAATDEGQQLAKNIANLTGLDVASSDDATGSSAAGADWNLEQIEGTVETPVPFSTDLQNSYQQTLATIQVTTSIDTLDSNDGQMSLREAIIAANNQAGADTINLPQGTYALNITGIDENNSSTGDLDINSDITLIGAGSANTSISGGSLGDRLFDVSSAGSLTISNVKLESGGVTDARGGGIDNEGILNASDIVLENNQAPGRQGGAIYNTGTAQLTNATVINNDADRGAGIFNAISSTLDIQSSTIQGNDAVSGGGGIDNEGTLTLDKSTVANNTAGSAGGGMRLRGGDATVTDSTFIGNTVTTGTGGGIYADAGLTITGSTFEDNRATNNQGGGLVVKTNGLADIINSTFSGNVAQSAGGGITVDGGTLNLSYSTIANNSSDNEGAGLDGKSGTANVSNSIFSNNGSGSDVSGNIVSGGYNIFKNASAATFTGASNQDLIADPQLQPLAQNGGLTKTHAITANTPAHDSGNANNKPNVDQTGEPRDITPDIGAYEIPGGSSSNVIQVTTTNDVLDGDTSSYYALVQDNGNDGQISLREAIIAANSQTGIDTIQVPQGAYTLTITGKYEDDAATGDLDITSNIILQGADSATTTISGSTLDDRLIDIHSGARLEASDITLQDGGTSSAPGGAINNKGDLTLSNTVLANNVSTNSPGGALWNSGISTLLNVELEDNSANYGGAIHNEPSGTINIDGATLVGNKATGGPAGAINNEGQLSLKHAAVLNNTSNNGGGLYNKAGDVEIVNSTFSENDAQFRGGGISQNDGNMTIESTTVANNTAANAGAGLYVDAGTVTTSNSIYAGNTKSAGNADIYGPIISSGINIIETPDPASFSGASSVDLVGTDPQLQPLGFNGGLTQTFAITNLSPAHDAADANNSPLNDQRGAVRDVSPDIGAFELAGGSPPPVNQTPQLTLSSNTNNYIENTLLTVDTNASVTDTDSIDFDTGTFSVSSIAFSESNDLIAINSVGTGTGEIDLDGATVRYEGVAIGTWTGGNGATVLEISLNSDASVNAVTALAQSITFSIDSDTPSTQTRTLEYVVSDGDGATSPTASIDITVQASNDAPQIDTPFGRVFINEFHYDNFFTDSNERIEIAAGAGTDLTGWTLRLYTSESTGDVIYKTIPLSGIIPDQGNGIGTATFDSPNLQNGPSDGIALVNPSGTAVEFVSYEGVINATVGPAAGMTSQDVGQRENNWGSANNSIQRTDLGDGFNWSSPAANTFSAINTGQSTNNATSAYTIAEEETLTFSQATGNPITISDSDTLANIKLDLSVSSGLLTSSTFNVGPSTSISLTGSVLDLNSFLDGLTYEPDTDFNGQDTLSIVVDDQDSTAGSNQITSSDISIKVMPVNDAPVLDNSSMLAMGTQSEDTTPTTITVENLLTNTPNDIVSDVDNNALEGIAVVSTDNNNGNWQYSLDSGSTWNNLSASGSFDATVLDSSAMLRYAPDEHYFGSTNLIFRAWDQSNFLASGSSNVDTNNNTAYSTQAVAATVTITPVDDLPTISLDNDSSSGANANNYQTVFATGDAPITIADTDALIDDVDSTTLVEMTIVIDNPLDGATENLSIDTSNFANFSQTYNTASHTLTITAVNGSVADFESILKTAKYHNTSTTPTTTDRTITVTVTDPTDLSNSAQTTIAMVADSTAPTVTNNTPLATTEGSQDTITTANMQSSDDLQPIASLMYNITAAPLNGMVVHTSAPSIAITQFSQDMIDANEIMYVHNDTETGIDQFEFSVDDSAGNSNHNNVFNVTIAAVNDPPTINAPASLSVNEDTTLPIVNTISVNDSDATSLEVVLSVNSGVLSIIDTSGTLNLTGANSNSVTIEGEIAAINSALNELSYTPATDFDGIDSLDIDISDLGEFGAGGELSATSTVALNITPVNDAPTGTNNTISILEDQPYVFSDTDFGFNDIEADQFTDILVTALPSGGSLSYQGNPVAVGDTILASNIGTLIFTPTAHLNGTTQDGLEFKVGDNGGAANGGEQRAEASNSINFNIIAVNDPPEGSDNEINTQEDTEYTFSAIDFGFTDPIDSDTLKEIQITSVPAKGDLKLNGLVVSNGGTISASALSNGDLTFLPNQDENGQNYTSFQFLVTDNGGVTNSGIDQSQSHNTIIINVDAVNDAPTGTDKVVSLEEDNSYTLSAIDFGFSDSTDNHSLQGVVITSLPNNGQLFNNGSAVTSGSTITAASLAAGDITYTPVANANGALYATIGFKVQDTGGTSNGGDDTALQENTIGFDVEAVSDEPSGSDKAINIAENTTHTFNLTDFGFSDPIDSDQFVSIEIDQAAGSGTLLLNNQIVSAGQTISSNDIASGNFLYQTPSNTFGQAFDNFTFKVTDSGNLTNGGQNQDQSANTIIFEINDISQAPSGTDKTLTIDEDTPYTISVGDFGFSDPVDKNSFDAVTIESPTTGTLLLNGTEITNTTLVTTGDIANGLLVFKPDAEQSGSNYSALNFLVHDSGSTANNGNNVSLAPNTLTFNVTPVNDEPSGADSVIQIDEGSSFQLGTGNFGFSDTDNNSLQSVTINTTPNSGTLLLGGQVVSANTNIVAADIASGSLTYLPPANTFGQVFDNITFTVKDTGGIANNGIDEDQTPNTLIFEIADVSIAPSGSDKTLTINEDTSYIISVGDFGFLDSVDNDAFESVTISTPSSGSLLLNGTAITATTSIATVDIANGLLVFKPLAEQSGSSTVDFLVHDTGTTNNNGQNVSQQQNTLTFNVLSVNDAPTSTSDTFYIAEDNNHVFTVDSFGFSDSDNNALLSITINTLPTLGTLQLAGQAVTENQIIEPSSINNGELVFTPTPNGSGTTSFDFTVTDDGGTINGGNNTSNEPSTVTLNIIAANDAPSVINNGATFDEGSSNAILSNVLAAMDPDNSAEELLFTITQLPTNGVLTVDGIDATIGDEFSMDLLSQNLIHYTHDGSETSLDYFDFTLTDSEATIEGRFEIDISEVLDPAPVLNNSNFNVVSGSDFNTGTGDTLTNGNSSLLGTTTVNDSTFVIELVKEPESGTVVLHEDGSFVYSHNGSEATTDYFIYRVINEDAVSATARIDITVEPVAAMAEIEPVKFVPEIVFEIPQEKPAAVIAAKPEVVKNETAENTDEEKAEAKAEAAAHSEELSYSATPVDSSIPQPEESTADPVATESYDDSQTLLTEQDFLQVLEVRQHNEAESIQLINESSSNLSVRTTELLLDKPLKPFDIINANNFQRALSQVQNDLDNSQEETKRKYRTGTDVAVSFSISTTAGVLAWMLRGGALFGSFMAATPLWASIDPLSVTGTSRKNGDESNSDEVETIFD